ncbi:hypothetical protein [Staphylococcus phage PT1-9]
MYLKTVERISCFLVESDKNSCNSFYPMLYYI